MFHLTIDVVLWSVNIRMQLKIITLILSTFKNPTINIIALLVAIILYQNLSDTRWVLWADTLPYLNTRIIQLENQGQILEEGNAELVAAIEFQNARIATLGAVSEALESRAMELQQKVIEADRKGQATIRVVEREVIDQSCAGSMEYLYDSIGELHYNQ